MKTIVVTAAVIERENRFLVARRPQGVHLAGYWEFPGGKCEPGETLRACLERELLEELAVRAAIGSEIFTTTHEYPDRRIELHFFGCEISGEPSPQDQQDVRWVRREDLRSLQFPPADEALLGMLLQGTGD
jgi:8-oxo-dGTP diphosphatase